MYIAIISYCITWKSLWIWYCMYHIYKSYIYIYIYISWHGPTEEGQTASGHTRHAARVTAPGGEGKQSVVEQVTAPRRRGEGQTASGQTGQTVSGQTRPSVTAPGGGGGNLFNWPCGIGQTDMVKRTWSNGLESGHWSVLDAIAWGSAATTKIIYINNLYIYK